jgi:protein-S-isoprenylcysteine O-methyltransferase Ste14
MRRYLQATSLNVKALLGLVFLALAMALLVFIAAGTLRYWQGWLFLVVFFAAGLLHTLYGMKKDPALLQRRLAGGPMAERSSTQRTIMFFVSLGFIGLLVAPVLGWRFGWGTLPLAVVLAGDALIVVGFFITLLAFRENTFAAANVDVFAGQRVISSGPYAVVRHPQYAGAILYLLGIPLALGSWWGLLVFAAMMPFLIWRLLDEERLLARELPGYADYRNRLRWRLIPGVY